MNTGHFTLRDLKRQCREAAEILCRDHGYKMQWFRPSDGSETVYAPALLQKRFKQTCSFGKAYCDPSKGTLLFWSKTSYEYNEWDCELPTR